MLASIFDHMLAEDSKVAVLGTQLQHILASLTASLQAITIADSITSTSSERQQSAAAALLVTGNVHDRVDPNHALVKLILKITAEAPVGLHTYLRDAEPLLQLPALDDACR